MKISTVLLLLCLAFICVMVGSIIYVLHKGLIYEKSLAHSIGDISWVLCFICVIAYIVLRLLG